MKKIIKWLFIVTILLTLVSAVVYAAAAPHADVGGGSHTHSYSLMQNISPTCTTGGVASYRCSCGASYTNQGSPLGHSWSWASGSSAGCTYSGYNSYNCSRCGSSKTETIASLGHNWGSWKVSSYPTCTANGKDVRSCSRCGASDSRSTSAYGHNWQNAGIVTYVSCTTNEVTGYECFRCGAGKTEVTQSALGHNYYMTQRKYKSTLERLF
jgi:DNA-directed RNA polymerase subunit RPC12/RpoP